MVLLFIEHNGVSIEKKKLSDVIGLNLLVDIII